MAEYVFNNASIKLYYETGTDDKGQPIYTTKTYQNVRNAVSANQVQTVVDALNTLSSIAATYVTLTKTESIEN